MMRSWFLVPALDKAQLLRAWACDADVLVVDLVHVALSDKAQARETAQAFLADRNGDKRKRCFVLLHPHTSGLLEKDIDAALRGRADGLVLSGTRSPADIQRLDVMVSVREAMLGLVAGATGIVALCGDNAAGILNANDYMAQASPRLEAIGWSAGDLVTSLGGSVSPGTEHRQNETLGGARAALLLAAASSGIAALDTETDAHENFTQACRISKGQGFAGRFTTNETQLATINAAFTPTVAEIDHARNVIDLFDKSDMPTCFTPDGRLLQRADLLRARRSVACGDSAR